MLIKRCDKCGQDVDKIRQFRIHEVDPFHHYVHTQSVYEQTRLNLKEAILDLCPTCTKVMGFENYGRIKKDQSIEDVFRAFIEVIVEDTVSEHLHD